MRVFCEQECALLRPSLHWTQINLSQTSQQGTVRGMHFQYPPAAEAKLIRCLRGRVFDVAVDLRAGSTTFLHWHGVELSEERPMQVFIPEGFAHGFQALTDDAQLSICTPRHGVASTKAACATMIRTRHRLALPVTQVSEKDRAAPLLDRGFAGVRT